MKKIPWAAAVALGLFLTLSTLTHSEIDPSPLNLSNANVSNILGKLGAFISDLMLESTGKAGMLISFYILLVGIMGLFGKASFITVGLLPVVVVALCGVFGTHASPARDAGGIIGSFLPELPRVAFVSILLTSLAASFISLLRRRGGVKEEGEGTETTYIKGFDTVSLSEPEEHTVTVEQETEEEMVDKMETGEAAYSVTPSLSLLEEPEPPTTEDIEPLKVELERVLEVFGIRGKVVSVRIGPVVSFFEFKPTFGTKVSRIFTLTDELMVNLKVESIRTVMVPGAGAIGFEIPRRRREIVRMKEILASDEFSRSSSPVTLALGKNIHGKPLVADLSALPHLLIAGTTGSGKSVLLHSCILSLIFKSPDVKLILVDPKVLEFQVYSGIPNLICDVITDPQIAAEALKWAVSEMKRRFEAMSAVGVRSIDSFNEIHSEEPMSRIVIFIDELADLMTVARDKVETAVRRLSQMARAAGIHLVVATQRPSVDIITGVIKANLPARIALKVSSKTDSRVIMDSLGAEMLLGYGDMLYLAPGLTKPVRIHGVYVSEREIRRVTDYLKRTGSPEYIEIAEEREEDKLLEFEGKDDPKYKEAIELARTLGEISISKLQRKLKIGFNRAARIVEMMEEEGLLKREDKKLMFIG